VATKAPAAAAPRPEPRREAQTGSGNPISRFWNFIKESVAELKKVEWPSQNQVIQGTVVVLVACVIVGLYLYVNDKIWQEVVKRIL
jgi:preprotein translocase subunit SecE